MSSYDHEIDNRPQSKFTKSDQFDIRVTINYQPEADTIEEAEKVMFYYDIQRIETYLNNYYLTGKVRYYHISGIEIGSNDRIQDVFGKHHVHVALVLHNYTTLGSVRKLLHLKEFEGYYISARNKKLKISGWLDYHAKMTTKIDGEPAFRVQMGELPRDKMANRNAEEFHSSKDASMEMRRKEWKRRKYLIINGDYDTLDYEFPGFRYSTQGRSMINDLMKQRNDEHCQPVVGELRNYIIWGASGTGKSASVAFIYPRCYKKQKGTQFWDGYDRTNPDHKVVWIDEMSKETLKCMSGKADGGFEFLKELGDRYPVTVDAKYMPAQKIRPNQIIITMNEHPTSLLPDRAQAINKEALYRKFHIISVNDWLYKWNLKCVPGKGVDVIPLPNEVTVIEVSDSDETTLSLSDDEDVIIEYEPNTNGHRIDCIGPNCRCKGAKRARCELERPSLKRQDAVRYILSEKGRTELTRGKGKDKSGLQINEGDDKC